MAFTGQPLAAPSRLEQARRRVFRAQLIPPEWTGSTFLEHLQEYFPDSDIQVHSLLKHLDMFSALVTFRPLPEQLSALEKDCDDVSVEIGGSEIVFEHCLGLTTLFEPRDEPPKADIIFVHGLGGHAIGSWSAPNGKCWPRDFLGNDLQDARVVSFGYEAKLDKDTSTSQLSDFGTQLLGQLDLLRASDPERPLFLVGHSFGGTIINWVLHELSSNRTREVECKRTLNAIQCATFFGTPHQGMSIEYLEPLTQKRSHSSMLRVLQDLRQGSETLKMLGKALRSLTDKHIRFITCVEQKLTRVPLVDGQSCGSYLAVNMDAAQVFTRDENIISIHADHQKMVKFSHSADKHYQQVLSQLRQALENCGQASTFDTLTKEKSQRLKKSLRFPGSDEWEVAIKNALETTCEWLLKSSEYINWSSSHKIQDPFLWIKGNTGSGKSTTIKFVATHHSRFSNKERVISFFFNRRGTNFQKTSKGMYQSLLLQVLEGTEEIPCPVTGLDQWTEENHPPWQISTLKKLLEHFIPRFGRPLLCFIDALDECQRSDIQDMMAFFEGLSKLCDKKKTTFRVCFSCKHDTTIPTQSGRTLFLEEQDGHSKDVLKYTEQKLQIEHIEYAQDTQEALQQKARGNFLWAMLVVEIVNKEVTRGPLSLLRRRLDSIPADLPGLYHTVLTQNTEDKSREKLHLCVQWVLLAQKPLTPVELYFAILSGVSPDASEMVIERAHPPPTEEAAKKFVLDASKRLVEISRGENPVVKFVHESVLNFLLDDETFAPIVGENQEAFRGKCHDRLKYCCLNLLGGSVFSAHTSSAKGVSKEAAQLSPKQGNSLRGNQDEFTCSYNSQEYSHNRERTFGGPIGHSQNGWHHNKKGADELHFTSNTGHHIGHDDDIDDEGYQTEPSSPVANFSSTPMVSHPVVSRPVVSHPVASKFATENVLYHSNEAERHGVSQIEFLKSFPLESLTQATSKDTDQKFYPSKASLLYILAERNLSKLIEVCPNSHSYLDPEQGQYGSPFFAALAKGNMDTIRSFFNIESKNSSRSSHFLDQRSVPQKYSEMCESYLDAVKDLQKDFLPQICGSNIRGISDYKAMTTFMQKPGNEVLHMFLLLTGREELKDNKKAASLFRWSAEKGRVKFLDSFIEEGNMDPNGEASSTALMLAAQAGQANAIAKLLSTGMKNFDRKDKQGQTPLSAAAAGGHVEAAKVLLASGKADIESKDNNGRTPLSLAALNGKAKSVALLLSNKSVRVNTKDNTGRTPLSLAVDGSNLDALEHLFRSRADANLSDNNGRTPISWAAEKGFLNISKYLVDVCGVDKHLKDVHGKSPLAYASQGRLHLKVNDYKKIGEFDAVIRLLGGDSFQLTETPEKAQPKHKTLQHEQEDRHEQLVKNSVVPQHDDEPYHVHKQAPQQTQLPQYFEHPHYHEPAQQTQNYYQPAWKSQSPTYYLPEPQYEEAWHDVPHHRVSPMWHQEEPSHHGHGPQYEEWDDGDPQTVDDSHYQTGQLFSAGPQHEAGWHNGAETHGKHEDTYGYYELEHDYDDGHSEVIGHNENEHYNHHTHYYEDDHNHDHNHGVPPDLGYEYYNQNWDEHYDEQEHYDANNHYDEHGYYNQHQHDHYDHYNGQQQDHGDDHYCGNEQDESDNEAETEYYVDDDSNGEEYNGYSM